LKNLALHQPVAVDLWRVATILKINGDLERIADRTVNIAERASDLSAFPELAVPKNLEKMVDVSTKMDRSSLDALVELDANLAREICGRDDVVDELNREVIDDLFDVIQSKASLVSAAFHFFSAARHVERIADHATNIAEDVIYLVKGEIVRHGPKEQQGLGDSEV
jgi:phosphate transport system protein